MEQTTVACYMISIIDVIQTQSQNEAVLEIVRLSQISANSSRHFSTLTLFHVLEVFIDLHHINKIHYYYYYYGLWS